jgi:predicted glycosyltransferase
MLDAWHRDGHEVLVVARDKDITFDLLAIYGIPYQVMGRPRRGRIGLIREFVGREAAMLRTVCRFRPQIITGSSPNAVRVAKLYGAKSVIMAEDDAKYIPLFRWASYPLASAIVTPTCLAYEDYGVRHLTYPSYQKLFYLHPNRFTPDRAVIRELGIADGQRYGLIRLSALQAHHDWAAQGVNEELVRRVIRLTENDMRIFITSEKPLPPEFEPFRLPISAERIHHALALAEFFIGDSQSMTVEAALLGTPAFKLNTFAGIISVIRELEEYGLAYGYKPGDEDALVTQLQETLEVPDRRARFQTLRQKMLSEKIDPLPWYLEIIRMLLNGSPITEVKAWSTEALRSGRFAAAQPIV